MGAFAKKYQTQYVVEGSETFPLDMLRYDEAFPARETDSHFIAGDGLRQITLVKCHHDREPHIEVRRWVSYGWRVLHIIETRKL